MTLEEIIKARRSVRIFDQQVKFDHEKVTRALELTLLAANSSNLQTWEFYRIQDKEKIRQMVPLCLKQNACRTASELVLFVSRRDLWRSRCTWNLDHIADLHTDPKRIAKSKRYYGVSIPFLYKNDFLGIHTLKRFFYLQYHHLIKKPLINWVTKNDTRIVSHKTMGIAAAHFMLSMTDQGCATCPMEGFDEFKVKKFLKLPKEAEISIILACGLAAPEGVYYDRTRLNSKDVVFEI